MDSIEISITKPPTKREANVLKRQTIGLGGNVVLQVGPGIRVEQTVVHESIDPFYALDDITQAWFDGMVSG